MVVIRGRFSTVAAVLLLGSPAFAGCAIPLAEVPVRAATHHAAARTSLLDYVHPLIGTAGDGNVFPGASAPFGMVQWSPDTSAGGLSRPGGYAYGDRIISGFSVTHLSGAGCVAFGNLPFMPTTRPFRAVPQSNGSPYSDRFLHTDEHASPGLYSVRLASGIVVQLSTTSRAGYGIFSFPRGSSATIVVNAGAAAAGRLNTDGALDSRVIVVGPEEISGWTTSGHFCNLGNRYRLYFDVRFDRPFSRVVTWQGTRLKAGVRHVSGPRAGAAVMFAHSQTVKVKIGLSYVSVRNAQLNLGAELPGWNDAAVRSGSQAAWSNVLGRVRASGGAIANERIFYTALYHSFLHPNIFSDVNGQYLGFDGRIHRAGNRVQYANYSGWDIYRSEVQLLAWLLPHETSDMMQSLLNDAQQQRWLPKWPVANAETGEMNGDSIDAVLANAYAFGARDFDAPAALRFMLKGANQVGQGPAGYMERPGLRSYLRLGYIPGYDPVALHPYGAAATTLEYNIDDFAIAQLAKSLGNAVVYRTFLGRSHSWRRLFNPVTKLIEPRMDSGAFPSPFSPTSMDGYVEGNALQYTWMVPHDLPALVLRIGGTSQTVRRLDPLFRRLDGGPTDPYDWAGNEPGFTMPWVYDFAGAPWRTQAVVHQIEGNRYTTTVGGLPGNDDLGALSSWYVWAALGLYPEIPGIGGWAVTSPLFPRISLHTESGNRLEVGTQSIAPPATYIQSLRLDGRLYQRAWLPASALEKSSTLTFSLGIRPNTHWGR